MPSLLTSADKESFIKDYLNFFDTFKVKIIVWKNPLKSVSNVNSPAIFGYGDNSNLTNFTYVPVSGIYYGIVTHIKDQQLISFQEANDTYPAGEVSIDVSGDANDFIKDGPTLFIQIENQKYHIISEDKDRNFLGYPFYSYELRKTN
jgi:hypothetical protein